jgi:chromosome segregation ATPase
MKSNEELQRYQRLLIESEQELKETKRRKTEIIEELNSLGLNHTTPGLETQLESMLHQVNLEIQELKDRLDELTKEDG